MRALDSYAASLRARDAELRRTDALAMRDGRSSRSASARVAENRRSGGRGAGRRGGGGGLAWSPSASTLTNLRGWYRADLGITLVGADVDAWADQSGIGNHLTAPGAGNRPLYVASDATLGSRPVVETDGVAEYLTKAAFSWGAAFSAFTFSFIGYGVTHTSLDGYGGYLSGGGIRFRQNATTKMQTVTPDGGGSDSTTNDSVPSLWTLSWDGANAVFYRGGAQESTSADATASVADGAGFYVGAFSTFANARFAEMILMRAAITAPQLANLQAYKIARYGGT